MIAQPLVIAAELKETVLPRQEVAAMRKVLLQRLMGLIAMQKVGIREHYLATLMQKVLAQQQKESVVMHRISVQ